MAIASHSTAPTLQRAGSVDDAPLVRVATRGSVTDMTNFGGAPYYVWQNLVRLGVRAVPHDTPMNRDFPLRRFAWNVGGLLTGRGMRGYMFSKGFLELAWSVAPPVRSGDALLNYFQLYPESLVERAERGDISLFYYIDLTLHEFFNEWGPASSKLWWAGRGSQTERAMAQESRGYRAAKKVMTLSRRTAEVLATRYGIDRRKIVTVAPGANFDDDEIDRILARPKAPRSDFLIGYSGYDYRRKGLPKLAEAVLKARQAGAPLTLRVIGARPPELENRPGIELIGAIDKSREANRLIELMAECQLGCLLSFAEGLPISLVEFLRFGIPVIGTRVNGIPDVVTEDVGLLVEPGASVEEISALLARLAARGDEYRRLRENARAARYRASWRRAAEEIRDAMAG